MKSNTIMSLAAMVVLLAAGIASAATTTLIFPETKNVAFGQNGFNQEVPWGTYLYNQNYSGEPGDGYRLNYAHTNDMSFWDYDRAAIVHAMENDVMAMHPGLTGFHFTDPAQFGPSQANVTMTMYIQPANDWQNRLTDTPFSYGFIPSLRLSKSGANWSESGATFVQSSSGQSWDDSLGNTQLCFLGTSNQPTISTLRGDSSTWVMNSTGELWGKPVGYLDTYGYGVFRPWKLDTSVAWQALTNPAAAGFALMEDSSLETGEAQLGCVGTIFSHRNGFTAVRPYVMVTFDTSSLDLVVLPWTGLSHDFNHDHWVNFKDYLILEHNFGKSGMTQEQGDANGDGWVNYKDYIGIELQFGQSDGLVPEPITIGLLVAGGLAMLRRGPTQVSRRKA